MQTSDRGLEGADPVGLILTPDTLRIHCIGDLSDAPQQNIDLCMQVLNPIIPLRKSILQQPDLMA